MAYAVQFGNGSIYLFPNREAALRAEAKFNVYNSRSPYHLIVAGADIDPTPYYRGRIPARGVRFTKEDQSTPQLLALLAGLS